MLLKNHICFVFYLSICLMTVSVPALAVYDELIIPANSETGVLSKPLENGISYIFVVTGVCSNYDGDAWFDAEWLTQPGSSTWEEYDSTPPGEWDQQRDVLDMLINDTAVDWWGTTDMVNWAPHTYSPFHVYLYHFQGTGDPVKFHIADPTPFPTSEGNTPWYKDNNGYLSVTIKNASPVPEPTGIFTLLGGLGVLIRAVHRRKA